MKMKYVKPEIEITAFTTEDIITASGTATIDTANATELKDTDFDGIYSDIF